jgi:hypothetical protein
MAGMQQGSCVTANGDPPFPMSQRPKRVARKLCSSRGVSRAGPGMNHSYIFYCRHVLVLAQRTLMRTEAPSLHRRSIRTRNCVVESPDFDSGLAIFV